MKYLLLSLSLSALLMGCGGGHDKKKPDSSGNPPPSSVSSSSSSLKSTSTSTSSSSSSSTTTSSSSSSSVVSSIPFAFKSDSFISGDKIPIKYSCFGGETSPDLQWEISSPDIKSFALIVEDYDAIALVGYPYVHWNVYNIPAATHQIVEGATLHAMPLGSIEGLNHDGLRKYSGPCPPEGTGTHHYFFALYALNKAELSIGANKVYMRSEFETDYASAIIQKAEITGSYFYK